MPNVTELDTWTCFVCGRSGSYDDPRAHFTLTRVDENGQERTDWDVRRLEASLIETFATESDTE